MTEPSSKQNDRMNDVVICPYRFRRDHTGKEKSRETMVEKLQNYRTQKRDPTSAGSEDKKQ